MRALGPVALVALSACFSPSLQDCRLRCGVDASCPDGAACLADGYCHADANAPLCTAATLPLTVGSGHACSIDATGRLWCWGFNDFGSLGDGSFADRPQPTQVGFESDWLAVSAGSIHTCGIRAPGSLWCWGYNAEGQLGIGGVENHESPQPVGDGDDWRAVSAGGLGTCARRGAGSLWCWGINVFGQAGQDGGGFVDVPTQVGGEEDWQWVGRGDDFACGLRPGGALYCWGNAADGELGQGAAAVATSTPGQVPGTWREVAVGSFHACAVDSETRLYCWGRGFDGQLGNVLPTGAVVPTRVQGTGWSGLACGPQNCCAQRNDEELCWGVGNGGRLGNGTTTFSPEPVVLPGARFSAVAVGGASSCAWRADGTLVCWGNNDDGQLAQGTFGGKGAPRQIAAEALWSQVRTGSDHACAVRQDGSLWCWGDNAAAQLGDGTNLQARTPVRVGTDNDWVEVAVGEAHSCGRRADGSLWCWGDNSAGQLGLGLPAEAGEGRSVPTRVGSASDWLAVVAAGGHTCALRAPGVLYCWGGDRDCPDDTDLGAAVDWTSLSAAALELNGTNTSCGLRSDGSAWCWDWSVGAAVVMTPADPALGWAALGASTSHDCLVRAADGALLCAGENDYGQLGVGGVSASEPRTEVTGGGVWEKVSATSARTCAIDGAQALFCWGENGGPGLLGLGQTGDRDEPEVVDLGSTWAEVSLSGGVGWGFACGLHTDGSLWCWGKNDSAQLGDGEGASAIPLPVTFPP